MLAFQKAADETETEKLLREMIDALPYEVALIGPRGVVVDVNAQWATSSALLCGDVKGFSRGDAALEILRAVAACGDGFAAQIADGLVDVLAGAPAFHLEYPADANGSARWFSLDIRRMKDPRLGALLCRGDVTDQGRRFAAALGESERRRSTELQAVFSAVPIGIAVSDDPRGERIRGNPALEALTGSPSGVELSKAAPSGAPYRVMKEGREARTHELPMQRALRGETVAGDVLEIIGEDGARRTAFATAVPLYDDGGHPCGAVGAFMDITRLRQAEDALRESELRLQLALDSGNIGIYEWRLPGDEFIGDDRLRAHWGLSSGEGMNYQTFMNGVHPDDRRRLEGELARAVDPETREAFRSEFRVLDASDQAERWVAVTGTAFFEDGRPVRMVGTTQDITARKLAEIERQKFVSLAEQSVEFIGVCNLAFEPLYVNPAGLRLLGLRGMEAALRIKVEDVFFPEDRPFIFEDFFPKVLREGQANVEIRFRRFDNGEALWMLYHVFFLRDPFGAPIGFATVSRDITQRKHAEEALKDADRRKDEFLATLAHELRNPLAPIRNAAYVLLHGGNADHLTQRDVDLLSMIDRQSGHLVHLVDDLLEVSRITRGKIELRKQRTDLNAVLRHAIETAQPTIARGGHRLDVRVPPTPVALEADPVRLAQVFTNLLNNAAKYTEQGGAVSLVAEQAGDEAIVTVRDSGVGIPEEMLPRVFDIFTQIDRTLGRAQGGLGIGLALVKRLVELHGGAVEAHSDGLGRGSAFVVRLPVLAENGAKAPMSSIEANDLTAARRILVIDDDHDVADSLVMFLETFGANVHVAYSGEAGIAAVQEFRPDLVFLDLGMPKMDGYETARKIRELPEGREVKLVALTGWGQGQIRERAQDAGFDCQLTKPAGIEALQALLGAI